MTLSFLKNFARNYCPPFRTQHSRQSHFGIVHHGYQKQRQLIQQRLLESNRIVSYFTFSVPNKMLYKVAFIVGLILKIEISA